MKNEVFYLVDLFPELKVEDRCDLRKVTVLIGNMEDGDFKVVEAPSPYYSARTPHNAVCLSISGEIDDSLIDIILEHVDADLIRRTKSSVYFSIFGLRTDLPFWY